MPSSATNTATILVFVALPEEHDRLLEWFPPHETISDPEHVFIEHDIQVDGFRMVSVLAKGMGIDNAYDATQAGISRFAPDLVVCIGIAGSLTSDLKIGDVGVCSEVIDVSQNMKITEVKPNRRRRPTKPGKAPRQAPPRTVIELSPKTLMVPPELSASFRFLRSHPTLKTDLAAWADQATLRREKQIGRIGGAGLDNELSQTPTAEIGSIISGPVVASGAFKEALKKIDRKVLSVETESSGVFRAAVNAKVPCITIRGISDHADINKNALERTTKQAARQLAADNAITYLALQLRNPTFMRIAASHLEEAGQPQLFQPNDSEPDKVLAKIAADLDSYLEKMSPEYKHRPNSANLPIPRISRDVIDDDIEDLEAKIPKAIFDAL